MRVPRLRWWLLGAVVLVVAVVVGGPFVYIHLIEGPPPSKLALPSAGSGTGGGAGSGSGTPGTGQGVAGQPSGSDDPTTAVDGVWHATSGSRAGYRVDEILLGQHSTAVGRTGSIDGSFVVQGTTVRQATFTVDMRTVVSDQSARNAQFRGPIMDVARYPTATFALTSPIALGRVPPVGAKVQYRATGNLQLHGVTRSVTFALRAERLPSSIFVLADIDVPFRRWDIHNPSIGGFVTTQQHGTLEVLLHLVRGTSPGSPAGPGGIPAPPPGSGPITVPKTTVPRLNIPGA